MLGYGSCYDDKLERNFVNNKVNYSLNNVADERYNSYHSLRDGNCRYPDLRDVSSFYNPAILIDRNEKHNDLPVMYGKFGDNQPKGEKDYLRNEFLKYGSRNPGQEGKLNQNSANIREGIKRKHSDTSGGKLYSLTSSATKMFKEFIEKKGMISNNFDVSRKTLEPKLGIRSFEIVGKLTTSSNMKHEILPDKSVVWENELNKWRWNTTIKSRKAFKEVNSNKHLIGRSMELLNDRSHPSKKKKEDPAKSGNGPIVPTFSADMTRFVVGGSKNRHCNGIVSVPTEVIDTQSVGADDSGEFGSVITKFNVFDYGHKRVDVDKLKIVDPHLSGVPCVNNENDKVEHVPSSPFLGNISVPDMLQHVVTQEDSHEVIGTHDVVVSSPLPGSPKDKQICKLRTKISTQLKSLADLVTCTPNPVDPDKDASSNPISISPTKSAWRLIPLVTPLRVIFSKANIDVTKCHKSDPRVMHLR